MTVCTVITTPLGPMLAAAENQALIGLWFIGQKHFPRDSEHWINTPELDLFQQLQKQLDRYFEGFPEAFDLPLSPRGTAFQQEIWRLLKAIPSGTTTTYGQLARILADRRGLHSMSAQAVGSAVGRNPVSILIPCHRVVGADGTLTGYAGGLSRKESLLKLEKAIPAESVQSIRILADSSVPAFPCSDR